MTEQDGVIERKEVRIIRLEKLLADFKRALYGAKSEKGHPDQYHLALEDIETALSAMQASPVGSGWLSSTLRTKRLIPPRRRRQNPVQVVASCPNICRVLKK